MGSIDHEVNMADKMTKGEFSKLILEVKDDDTHSESPLLTLQKSLQHVGGFYIEKMVIGRKQSASFRKDNIFLIISLSNGKDYLLKKDPNVSFYPIEDENFERNTLFIHVPMLEGSEYVPFDKILFRLIHQQKSHFNDYEIITNNSATFVNSFLQEASALKIIMMTPEMTDFVFQPDTELTYAYPGHTMTTSSTNIVPTSFVDIKGRGFDPLVVDNTAAHLSNPSSNIEAYPDDVVDLITHVSKNTKDNDSARFVGSSRSIATARHRIRIAQLETSGTFLHHVLMNLNSNALSDEDTAQYDAPPEEDDEDTAEELLDGMDKPIFDTTKEEIEVNK
jgi:hypothetical protein